MTKVAPVLAKALIAALGAAAVTANTVARAHGWHNVDWTPIAMVWSTAVAVFAYPNGSSPPTTPTG